MTMSEDVRSFRAEQRLTDQEALEKECKKRATSFRRRKESLMQRREVCRIRDLGKERRKAWNPMKPPYTCGKLAEFVNFATSASLGSVTEAKLKLYHGKETWKPGQNTVRGLLAAVESAKACLTNVAI